MNHFISFRPKLEHLVCKKISKSENYRKGCFDCLYVGTLVFNNTFSMGCKKTFVVHLKTTSSSSGRACVVFFSEGNHTTICSSYVPG